MAYWNHFSERKYQQIYFKSLNVGDKFRVDRFKQKRRRKDIIMIKKSDTEYYEFKSGKYYKYFSKEAADTAKVYSYDKLNKDKK
jgi:hypothetical protein